MINFEKQFDNIESKFKEIENNLNSQYKFCFGNKPSIADIFLVPQIFSANRFKIDISKLTNLKKIFEKN